VHLQYWFLGFPTGGEPARGSLEEERVVSRREWGKEVGGRERERGEGVASSSSPWLWRHTVGMSAPAAHSCSSHTAVESPTLRTIMQLPLALCTPVMASTFSPTEASSAWITIGCWSSKLCTENCAGSHPSPAPPSARRQRANKKSGARQCKPN
jgi:hypothetical protein